MDFGLFMKLPSFLPCSSSLIWTGDDFSVWFENLIFGFIPNLVTLLLIAIHGMPGSSRHKLEVWKLLRAFNVKRHLWLEILPAMAGALSVLVLFQFFLKCLVENHSPWYIWLHLASQCVVWVVCCWDLHFHYEVVLGDARVLCTWWFLRPLLNIPFLRSMLLTDEVAWSPEFVEELFMFILAFTFGALVLYYGWKSSSLIRQTNGELIKLTEAFVHTQMDGEDQFHDSKVRNEDSMWSILMFGWVTPLMDLGIHQQLSYADLLPLPESLTPKTCSRALQKTWADERKSIFRKPSLFRAIFYAYFWPYLLIGVLKIVNDTLGFIGPLLLNAIIKSLQVGSNESYSFGYWCAFYLGVISTLRAFMGTQYTFLVSRLRLQLRASIITLIYRKALCVSLSERGCFSSGEIQTFMSVDAERIVNSCASFHELWSLPLQMVVSLYLLYTQVKFAFLAGVTVIILLIPVNKWIATRISTASQAMMKEKDERVRKMGELLMNIRTIKMYTWEILFADRVMKSRENELKFLGVRKYLDAWCVYFWATTPSLFSFFTFGLFALLGYTLDAATVFTSLSLFNMLISPLNSFPWVVNGLIEASVSLQRLCRFLSCPEIHHDWTIEVDCESSFRKGLTEEENSTPAILICNAEFTWSHSKQEDAASTLKNISLSIPQGSLVLLLGEIGAGKSSLFEAILGEMRCIHGGVFCQGHLAYVPQTPWIHSGSIRENILFGSPYSEERYMKVLDACALDVDVERMTGGDSYAVREHGFNLSGGQRARLALARAIYQDCDIYLFDDPLSAVDAHVASWLLEYAIQGPLLEGKTRILCTYNSQALAVADMVVLMESGTIQWLGNLTQFHSYLIQEGMHVMDANKLFSKHFPETKSGTSLDGDGMGRITDEIENQISSEVSYQNNAILAVEDEDREMGSIPLLVYRNYLNFVGWSMLSVILISTSLMQLSRSGNDFWLSFWVDKTSGDKLISFFLMVLLIFAVANSFFTLSRAFSFAYGGLCAASEVHETLLKGIVSAPIQFFEQNQSGRILNRFSSDQYSIDDTLPFKANILLADLFGLLGIIVVLCIVQWTFLLFLVPLSYIYINLQKYYRETSRELRRLDSTSRSPIYSSFAEALDGAPTIRAFTAQVFFSTINEKNVELNQQASFSEIAASLWLSVRLQMLAAFLVFFISIMAFATNQKTSKQDSTKAGLVGLSLSYVTPIISLLGDLLAIFTETEKEMVSMERLQQYMQVEGEQMQGKLRAKHDWPTEGSIEFSHVTLAYMPSLPPALHDVSFSIKGGNQVGIVGRTGAGKSSVLNALFHLTPLASGRILIDAVDTAEIDLTQLRSNLSIVPQSPFLFEGTLRENLDPARIASDLQLWESLRKCHLKGLVMAAGGLDIHILEGGKSFSVGQQQLLCLARSLLRSAKILCLDECTANVDLQTTALLKTAVANECRGITVITIAHRLSTILGLDHVLIFDHGKLVEEGNPQALLTNAASRFSSLAKASCT